MKTWMKRSFSFLLVALTLLCASGAYAQSSVTENAALGVVRIITVYEKDGNMNVGMGTGFAVGNAGEAPLYYVTNWHVAAEPDETLGKPTRVYILLQDNAARLEYTWCDWFQNGAYVQTTGGITNIDIDNARTVRCEVVDTTEGYPDYAILKADRAIDGVKPLTLRSTEGLARGGAVYALGYPAFNDSVTYVEDREYFAEKAEDGYVKKYYYAENRLGATKDMCSSTNGIVSLIGPHAGYENTVLIQHTAAINHGNSGGPLITADGEVIGINTYGRVDTENAFSVSLAVDINYVIDALTEEKIPFAVAGPNVTLIVIICAAIVVLLALLILLWLQRKKGISLFGRKKNATDKTIPASSAADSGFRIQGVSGVYANKRFSLNGEVSIGRDARQNNLSYPNQTKGVSSAHCLLSQRGDQVYLRDLKSSFGTFVNGRKLQPMVETELHVGDMFSIGTDKETFRLLRKDAAR